MAVSLPACVTAFILAVLCGNPILKGAFITSLNTILLQLDLEISQLLLQVQRLDVLSRLLSIEIQAVQTLANKVSSDLNLFLEPFQEFQSCTAVTDLNKWIQDQAGTKKLIGFQNKLYEYNRVLSLKNALQAASEAKEQQKATVQGWIDKINELCP